MVCRTLGASWDRCENSLHRHFRAGGAVRHTQRRGPTQIAESHAQKIATTGCIQKLKPKIRSRVIENSSALMSYPNVRLERRRDIPRLRREGGAEGGAEQERRQCVREESPAGPVPRGTSGRGRVQLLESGRPLRALHGFPLRWTLRVAAGSTAANVAGAEEKPDIVYMLVDNWGWGTSESVVQRVSAPIR